MRESGTQARRIREFLGLSQQELARRAGLSQGAVSRFEAGRGLATPYIVALKLYRVLTQALAAVDPALLSDDLRRTVETGAGLAALVPVVLVGGSTVIPITNGPDLEEIVRLYHRVPEGQRPIFLKIVRAIAVSLGPRAPAIPEGSP